MPSRVIRGEINSSGSLGRVSMRAELTFDRLLTAVDDYGRYDARPAMLKAGLFPVRSEATPKKIAGWVAELAHEGCIRLYQVGGRPYLAMTAWEKHRGKARRGTESKFPAPPETHSPASADPLEIHGDPPVGRGAGGEGREAGGGFDAASPPSKKSSGSVKKQKTLCPEKPTPEQWAKILKWRDDKHPEFTDDHLKKQWSLLHAYHGGVGNRRENWLLSFYYWLTNDIGKPQGVSTARSPPREYEPGQEKPPPQMTDEQIAAMEEEHMADLESAGLGRRLRH